MSLGVLDGKDDPDGAAVLLFLAIPIPPIPPIPLGATVSLEVFFAAATSAAAKSRATTMVFEKRIL
jgi:hypothetical protein